MNVDRVVLAWDGNPRYDGFYSMHQKIWSKLGIKTGLVFVSDGSNLSAVPNTGDVIVVEDKSKAPRSPLPGRNWKATMGMIHGPRLFPNETTMVVNMDQFPASRRFLNAVEHIPDDKFATNFCDKTHINTSHIVARHDTWEKIMMPAPLDFTDLIDWAWGLKLDLTGYGNIAIGWGSDEVILTRLVQKCEGLEVVPAFRSYAEDWLNRVLGITQKVPDVNKLKSGWYSELHIRLPMSKLDKSTFDSLLRMDPFP